MASNGRYGNPNQLQRSGHGNIADIRNLGSLGTLAMHNTPNAVPLSTSYLQQPMGYNNCGIPPLPARRNPLSSYGRMGMGMGNCYSPYSRYPTNMYTPGYGGYRMSSYGQFGGAPETSSFMQMAEESTRPAFESIESVVEVVSSISMMLESTYHAVHSSYSAILGVVDQFSRLKDHLAQMLSILALLRGLRWLCLKFLYLLRLRKENPSDEAAWSSAAARSMAGQSNLPPRTDKSPGSAWPFLMFVGLVIGAPWLMFKLLSKTLPKKPLDTKLFQDDYGRHVTATTAVDFKATQSDELSFSAGEKLYISPASTYRCPQGWLYACNSKQETGLIPSTYLVLNQKKLNARNAPNSFQQLPPQGVIVRGPSQHFDYSRDPVGNFNPQPNSVQNFSSQPNPVVGNFGPQPNSVQNIPSQPNPVGNFTNSPVGNFGPQPNSVPTFNSQPSDLDYSRNPGQNPNIRPGDFNLYPDINSNIRPSNLDYLRNPTRNPNIRPGDQSVNVGERFNPGPDTLDGSKNPVGTPDSRPDGLKNSADNFNPHSNIHDCPPNAGDKVNAQPGVFGSSKDSTEEIENPSNDKVTEVAAKNKNVNPTEN